MKVAVLDGLRPDRNGVAPRSQRTRHGEELLKEGSDLGIEFQEGPNQGSCVAEQI